MARRHDTTWVSIMSGGTEIGCNVDVPMTADRDTLLLHKLPRTPRLVSVSAHCVIHTFVGGAAGLDSRDHGLAPAEIAALEPPTADRPAALAETDRPLLEALALDGRLAYPQLAGATGWSESAVRRRLDELTRSGAVYFDVEVDPDRLGVLDGVERVETTPLLRHVKQIGAIR